MNLFAASLVMAFAASLAEAATPFGGADHAFTLSCDKQTLVDDTKLKKKYDLSNQEVAIGKYWRYKEHAFRVSSYFVNKKFKLAQPLVTLSRAVIRAEDERHALVDSHMIVFNVMNDGKVKENAGQDLLYSEQLDAQVELTFAVDAAGTKTLYNKRTTVPADPDSNIIYYRQEAALDDLKPIAGLVVTKNQATCTYVRLPDSHFVRTPGALFEHIILRLDDEIKKLKELSETVGAEAQTQEQLQAVLDLWPKLITAAELEKIDFAKQRQKKPAVILESDVAIPGKKTKAAR